MNKGTHMHYKYGDEDNRKGPDRKKGNAPTTKKHRFVKLLYRQPVLPSNTKVLSKYYQLQASHELNLFFLHKRYISQAPKWGLAKVDKWTRSASVRDRLHSVMRMQNQRKKYFFSSAKDITKWHFKCFECKKLHKHLTMTAL